MENHGIRSRESFRAAGWMEPGRRPNHGTWRFLPRARAQLRYVGHLCCATLPGRTLEKYAGSKSLENMKNQTNEKKVRRRSYKLVSEKHYRI